MAVRTGEAFWNGNLQEGQGRVKYGGREQPYSFTSRFEAGKGTNPEELLAAAHAGCFSMALSNLLSQAGYPPQEVHTIARVHLEKIGDRFAIPRIELETTASVPNINERDFQQHAEQAKENCPVCRRRHHHGCKTEKRGAGWRGGGIEHGRYNGQESEFSLLARGPIGRRAADCHARVCPLTNWMEI